VSVSNKTFLVLGCIILLIGVQLGALGSHALDDVVTPKKLESWKLAVQYQLIHGLALVVITTLPDRFHLSSFVRLSRWLMLAGILMFSGNIYLSALGAPEALGIITPFGGVSLMLAWLMLAIGIARIRD